MSDKETNKGNNSQYSQLTKPAQPQFINHYTQQKPLIEKNTKNKPKIILATPKIIRPYLLCSKIIIPFSLLHDFVIYDAATLRTCCQSECLLSHFVEPGPESDSKIPLLTKDINNIIKIILTVQRLFNKTICSFIIFTG